jgi:sugar O-acyltransferase (sialic acid O-acetyltransferase NeuD family)
MNGPVVVVGAGGHGREVVDVLVACVSRTGRPVFNVVGVLDDDPSEVNLQRLKDRGLPWLGRVDTWTERGDQDVRFVLGIGSSAARRAVASRLIEAGFQPATAVHPTAVLGSRVALAPGVVVFAGAVVATNTALGRHTHIHRCATVGHDCVIGSWVTVNPSASISGDCVIEDDVMVGVSASVLQGLTVHEGAVVGGAACVVTDVPAHTTVKGVPAR